MYEITPSLALSLFYRVNFNVHRGSLLHYHRHTLRKQRQRYKIVVDVRFVKLTFKNHSFLANLPQGLAGE